MARSNGDSSKAPAVVTTVLFLSVAGIFWNYTSASSAQSTADRATLRETVVTLTTTLEAHRSMHGHPVTEDRVVRLQQETAILRAEGKALSAELYLIREEMAQRPRCERKRRNDDR